MPIFHFKLRKFCWQERKNIFLPRVQDTLATLLMGMARMKLKHLAQLKAEKPEKHLINPPHKVSCAIPCFTKKWFHKLFFGVLDQIVPPLSSMRGRWLLLMFRRFWMTDRDWVIWLIIKIIYTSIPLLDGKIGALCSKIAKSINNFLY